MSSTNPLVDHKTRIYYIDLLRAMAILTVVVAHTVLGFGAPEPLIALQFGGSGVDLFFLLSGWLIGSQLFKEQNVYNNIELKRFWIRRWLRTFPAYYAVLFATFLQQYISKGSVESPVPYLFFYQNYLDTLPFFSVSWSLALEEQFYLVIAPFVLFITKLKRKYQSLSLVFLLLLPSLFRELQDVEKLYATHLRWDCCLMGVLLAQLHAKYPEIWQKAMRYSTWLASFCLFVYLATYWDKSLKDVNIIPHPTPLMLAFIFGGLLFFAINKPVSRIPIAHRFIMHISTRSYAMYLLHAEAIAICNRVLADENFVVFMTATFCLTMLLSECLYRTIEIPFLKLRDNFRFSQHRSKVIES